MLEDASLKFLLETDAELHSLLVEEELIALAEEERPKYITNYIGSKQKLVEWIWKSTPEGCRSAFDAFSGSSVVGYMYKNKGLRVAANDCLRYSYHLARALIENNSTRLTDADIEKLVANNSSASNFVQKHFKGLFFAKGIHPLIDNIRTNINALSGFKKDIALFALGKTCITAKAGFGHFSSSGKDYNKHGDGPKEFLERFKANCERISAMVFDNGKENQALIGNTIEIAPQIKADLAYFDPPYVTQFSNINYERSYHFIEGLMTYWKDKELDTGSRLKTYNISTPTISPSNAPKFFADFLGSCRHIPIWLISYRDKAYPTEAQVKKVVADLGRSSRMKSTDHSYQLSSKHSENSKAKERLFVCHKEKEINRAAADLDDEITTVAEDEHEDHLETYGEIDMLEFLATEADHVKVTSYMGNKHFMLDLLWKNTPKNATSMMDVFCGGCNVAYFYKQKGLSVIANDKLKYPHHIARAIIENSKETLSESDIEQLVADNSSRKTFIADNFYGYYFTRPILEFLDTVRSNADKLSGYKKDLSLFALGATCVSKARFGQFSRSKKGMQGKLSDESKQDTALGNIPLAEFKALFLKNVKRINGLVFDNGKECKALNLDAVDAMKQSKADLAYLDPPYLTEFGTNDYEADLHFVEGLMTYWEGKELRNNARKDFESSTRFTKDSIKQLFSDVVAVGKTNFPQILISYRDRAFPSESEIKSMLSQGYSNVKVKSMEVEYGIVRWDSARGGKYAKELLFVGSQADRVAKASDESYPLVTYAVGEIKPLQAKSANELTAADKEFRFILCHAGQNKNGDFFSEDELKKAYPSIVSKKIDLKHSQEFMDIVGGVVDSEIVNDSDGIRVEATGKIYVSVTPQAAHAYNLLKEGIVTHVSMECEYQEGECSICHKKVKSKADYCIHLKNYKGAKFNGKPCYEILHGVRFAGVGLLDKKGADENARILKVANLQNTQKAKGGEHPMDDNVTQAGTEEDAAKKKKQEEGGSAAPENPASDKDKDALIKELRAENARLKQEVSELQKKVQKFEEESQASARKARAEKLLKKVEQKGLTFASEDERTAELERLAKLNDEAFAAAEATYGLLSDKKDEKSAKETKPETKANLNAHADVRPLEVDDKPTNLEDKLKNGFMQAYHDRFPHRKEAAKQ